MITKKVLKAILFSLFGYLLVSYQMVELLNRKSVHSFFNDKTDKFFIKKARFSQASIVF